MYGSAPQHRAAFTLTEMLVVLGIILLLVSILIPVIIKAQNAAKNTQCQSRLREIGHGLQLYMNEFDQTLPPAINSNSMDSSLSRMACQYEGMNVTPGLSRGLEKSDTANERWFSGASGFPHPAPPLAMMLRRYIPVTEKNWSCPVLRSGPPGQFRTYKFVITEGAAKDEGTDGAFAGSVYRSDEFRPGYMYMAGVEYTVSLNKAAKNDPWDKEMAAKYAYGEFRSRSVSGLRLGEIKPRQSPLPGSISETPSNGFQVVTVLDYSLAAHSKDDGAPFPPSSKGPKKNPDANGNPDEVREAVGRFSANFLYLDGHVEPQSFRDRTSFLGLLHGPIPQPW